MTAVRQVQVHHVERHASRAITRRLGRHYVPAIIAVVRDGTRPVSVILHVNSGGNALAAERELRFRGYQVDHTEYDPFADGHYGVQLRVSPSVLPAARPTAIAGED
ncbi:hypothetical protein [Mycobacteroides abscessus]|uniref:hypothetical protein n=1 Tax=Mycobacteriaceae TaxID=1762 RepID=UPI0034E872BB